MHNHKTDNRRIALKTFLVLLGFCNVIFCLISIFALIISRGLHTVCSNIPISLNSNIQTITSLISGWGLRPNSQRSSILYSCLAVDSIGNVDNLFAVSNSTSVNTILSFVDGIVAFNSLLSFLSTQNNLVLSAINSTINIWQK